MAWTETTRPHYERGHDRYASDCTDTEWVIIEPFMPAPSRIGRPRKSNLREVWNAIQYIAATGCQWALLPSVFHPSRPSSIISTASVIAASLIFSTKPSFASRAGFAVAMKSRRQLSLMIRASRQQKRADLAASMPGRKSRAGNGTS